MAVCTPQVVRTTDDRQFERPAATNNFLGGIRQSRPNVRTSLDTPPKNNAPAGAHVQLFASIAASNGNDARTQKRSNLGGPAPPPGMSGFGTFVETRGNASPDSSYLAGTTNCSSHAAKDLMLMGRRMPSPNTTLNRPVPTPKSFPVSPDSAETSPVREPPPTGHHRVSAGGSPGGRFGAIGGTAARLAAVEESSSRSTATPPGTTGATSAAEAMVLNARLAHKLLNMSGGAHRSGDFSATASPGSAGSASPVNVGSFGRLKPAAEPEPLVTINPVCLNLKEVEELCTDKELTKATVEFIDISSLSSSVEDDGTETEYVIWGVRFTDGPGWQYPSSTGALVEVKAPSAPAAPGAFPLGATRVINMEVVPLAAAKLAERGAATLPPAEEAIKRLNGPREVDLDLLPKYMQDDDLSHYIFD